jgi:hypothetical protein
MERRKKNDQCPKTWFREWKGMKTNDIDLIEGLIAKLGIGNCCKFGELALEGILLGLCSSPHQGSHS